MELSYAKDHRIPRETELSGFNKSRTRGEVSSVRRRSYKAKQRGTRIVKVDKMGEELKILG